MSAGIHAALGDLAGRFPVLPNGLADALDEHGPDALAWVWLDGSKILRLEVDE